VNSAQTASWQISLRITAYVFVSALSLLLTGCLSSRGDYHDRAGDTKTVQGPAPAPKPHDCDKDSSGATQRFPDTVEVSGCVWRDSADAVATVGNRVVLWSTDDTQLQLRVLDAGNGGVAWKSEPIALGDPQARQGDYETFFDKGAYPLILTRGEASYIAVVTIYHHRASAVEEAQNNTRVRFYPLSSTGIVQPKIYNAPIGPFAPTLDRNDTARDGDQVLLHKEGTIDEPAKYLRVDPQSGQGSEFAPKDRFVPNSDEIPVAVTQDGNVVTTFKQERQLEVTDRFGLRSANGSKLWDGKDHAPKGADPQAGTVIGVRGKYLIVKWLANGSADKASSNNTRPGIIAVHNAESGDVIAASPQFDIKDVVDFDNAINRTSISSDGRYLLVGRAVFDLKQNKALDPLPDALSSMQAISPQGIAYGYGNESRPVAYDVVAKKSVWEMPGGEGAALLPIALTDKLAIFQFETSRSPVVALPVKAGSQPPPSEAGSLGVEQQPG
jgi:hypothetical protein